MPAEVLIVGGGTAGTVLANSLDRRRFRITLVTASLEHRFHPSLVDIAFKGRATPASRDERGLLAPHVRLLNERVAKVALREATVATEAGRLIGYDFGVFATGMRAEAAGIPGLEELGRRFGDFHSGVDQARRLWATLQGFEGGTIAMGHAASIVRCPPAPLEAVCLVDDLLRRRGLRDRTRLVFFTPHPRAYPALRMSEILEPLLARRGIEVLTFFDVEGVDPDRVTIHSMQGERVRCDIAIVVPPFFGADVSYTPARALDEARFVITEPRSLRIRGTDNAYAIGSGANLPTSKSWVGARLQAKSLARQLAGLPAFFDGRTHCPLEVGGGRATFIIGSYDAPVRRYRPTRLKGWMKALMHRTYWVILLGLLDRPLELYFRLTAPRAVGEPPADSPQAG